MSRRLLVIVLLLALTLPALGQSPPNQPTFGTGTTAVVVDVIVRDRKGNPVTDLRKGDFELLEDGVRQEIADLTLVSRGARARARAETHARATTHDPAPPNSIRTPTVVALVFDRLSGEGRAAAWKAARAALASISESDFFGVFVTDLSLHTLQTFTNDRAALERAIHAASTRATSVFSRDADRVRTAGPGDSHPAVPYTAGAEFAGRAVQGTRPPHDRMTDAFARSEEVFTRMARHMEGTFEFLSRDHQGFATTNALLALIAALSELPGRKSVVFFAESLALPIAVQGRFDSVIQNANRANVAIYAVDAAGLRVHSDQGQVGRELQCLGASAGVQAGCENVFDRLGMGYSHADLVVDLLQKDPATALGTLSRATGGFLINNTNDLARGFQQIDADRRFHYLLTYTPKNEQFDGEWRNVTVRVPGRRVDVRARTGYLAVRALGAIPLLAHEGPALAALDRDPRPTDLPITARAFIFPTGDDEARLAVLASTPASAITFPADDTGFRADFTILARIRDANGEVVRKASEPYRLSGPLGDKDKAQRGDVLFFRQPMLPAGRYTLDAVVHDALGKKAGVVSESFEVPAGSGLAVSSLVVVGRGERVADPQPDNPLYVGDVLVYPNLGEPINKTEGAITLFLTVVPVAGRTPSAELELLRGAEALAKVPLNFDAPVNGRIQQLWRVPIDTLEPGDYTFRVVVADGQGREVRETSVRVVD
jgi:VWFA-related protein